MLNVMHMNVDDKLRFDLMFVIFFDRNLSVGREGPPPPNFLENKEKIKL
jgi:hypothetical protein